MPFDLPEITPATTPEEYSRVLTALAAPEALGTMAAKCGITYAALDYDSMAALMPVEGNAQPFGLLHGGAHVVLAESLASMHAFLRSGGRRVVGVDLNATHLRAVTSGMVRGTATVLHAGRTIVSHEIRMTDEQGRLASIVRITNMVLSGRA